MIDMLITIGLLLLGAGISEYYHWRIDRARRELVPMDQPDMWDLTPPAPQPNIVPMDSRRRGAR